MKKIDRYSRLAMTWMQGFLALGPQPIETIKEYFPFGEEYLDLALCVAWLSDEGWELHQGMARTIFDLK